MLSNIRLLTGFYKYKRKLLFNALTAEHQYRNGTTDPSKGGLGKGLPLKILFFGTDTFSLPSLKALYNNRDGGTLGAVTSFKSPANCVRLFAEQHHVPLYRWPVDADICRNYDLGVVVSFGHLIPERLIRAFHYGMINVHASLLPRWRGAAPIIYAIMQGDAVTGVSIMRIEPKRFDIGDILAQRMVSIGSDVFMPEMHAQLANDGAQLLTEVVADFPKFLKNSMKQDDAKATLAPKITDCIIEVTWSEMDALQIYNRYRALFGFRNLCTRFQSKQVQLIDVRLPPKTPVLQWEKPPGTFVYSRERKCLLVSCARTSYIEVCKLRIEGKKVMSSMDFNNGFLKKIGTSGFKFETHTLYLNNKSVAL